MTVKRAARRIGSAVLLAAFVPLSSAHAGVVINEIFYNAPDDLDSVQWIEIHNPDDSAANLSGWTLDGGKIYTFPRGASVAGNGFLVVALNPAQFQKSYGVTALGPFKRALKRGGEKIALADAAGNAVDVARYNDRDPWPVSADGYSASLERISPGAPGDAPDNWAGSPLPPLPKPSGTPGKRNASASAVLPPVVALVTPAPEDASPDQTLPVAAEVKDAGPIKEVSLLYRTVTDGEEGAEAVVAMSLDAASGRYRGEIPAQPRDTLVRYRIRAVGETGAVRLYPGENDLTPARSTYVHAPWDRAKIPLAFLLLGGPDKPRPGRAPRRMPGFSGFGPGGFPVVEDGPFPDGPPNGEPGGPDIRFEVPPGARPGGPPTGGLQDGPPNGFPVGPEGGPPPGFFMDRDDVEAPRPPRGTSTLVYVDSETGEVSVFDFVNVPSRNGGRGYKAYFHKDRTLNGMSNVSIEYEGSERFMLSEALAYDLYRRAGSPAPESGFVRLWVNGHPLGYHLWVERPNRSFLRRNKIDDGGNLYKLLWYGNGIKGQHEKKTHTRTGHDDLVGLVNLLRSTKGDAQWKVIQDYFDVNQVATYFAVNMILSHWDGFFNNYYAYHDLAGTKKWMMFPWDQDKTWGYYDGVGENEVFTTMPLTFGMNGARPPGMTSGGGRPGGDPFGGGFGGGMGWWRPPGFYSGPLLANPQFRKVFLARTREILDTIYTKNVYFPLIDGMADRVREDVTLAARLSGSDPDRAARDLAHNVMLLRQHLLKRRQFLLARLGDKTAPRTASKSARTGRRP